MHFEKKKKMEKYNTVGTIPKFNRRNRDKLIPLAHIYIYIHDRSLSWIVTGTSIQSGGVKNTFMTFQSLQLESLMKQ